MSKSDLMSGMDLATYPQIALVLFLAVFAVMVVRVFSKRRAKEYEAASRLPLED